MPLRISGTPFRIDNLFVKAKDGDQPGHIFITIDSEVKQHSSAEWLKAVRAVSGNTSEQFGHESGSET